MAKYTFSTSFLMCVFLLACAGNTPSQSNEDSVSTATDRDEDDDKKDIATSYIASSVLPGFVRVYAIQDNGQGETTEAKRIVEGEDTLPTGETIPGLVRVRSQFDDGGYRLAWESIDGDALRTHRQEGYYEDGVMHSSRHFTSPSIALSEAPEHLEIGAIWNLEENYDRWAEDDGTQVESRSRSKTWTLLATDELATVPAGRYRCIHFRIEERDYEGKLTTFEKWYAKGIGMVRNFSRHESGSTKDIVLKSFTVPEGSGVDPNGED